MDEYMIVRLKPEITDQELANGLSASSKDGWTLRGIWEGRFIFSRNRLIKENKKLIELPRM